MLAIHDPVQSVSTLSAQNGSSALCVTVVGELDTLNVGRLTERVVGALRQYGPAAIQLDLAEVSFIDVGAAVALRRLHARAADSGCVLSVSAAQPIAWFVFNATGLSSIFATPERYRLQSEPGS